MKQKNKILFIILIAIGIIWSNSAYAYDTVGVNVSPYNFNQKNLVEIKWKADILEFEYNAYSGTNIIPLRIEFNSVIFLGSKGQSSMGVMIQNLLHKYNEASCAVSSLPGGLELYFTVMDANLLDNNPENDIIAGLKLDANPNSFPRLKRVFQDIDGLSIVGNNIYANDAISAINTPVTVEWHLTRGNLVKNPTGNLHKNINCDWESLRGNYREWKVKIMINGASYAVGTYYLPEGYASYLHKNSPLVLHQEHFGACNNRLDTNKVDVQYYDIKVLPEGKSGWISIPEWRLNYAYDGDCGASSSDKRHGIGTVVVNGKTRLVSRAGHNDDINMKREAGTIFSKIDQINNNPSVLTPYCGNYICDSNENAEICCGDCKTYDQLKYTCIKNTTLQLIPQVQDKCFTNKNCNDNNSCTIDICSNSPKTCSNIKVKNCVNNDNCCPSSCDYATDNDCKKSDKKVMNNNLLKKDDSHNNKIQEIKLINKNKKTKSQNLVKKEEKLPEIKNKDKSNNIRYYKITAFGFILLIGIIFSVFLSEWNKRKNRI